MRTATLFQAQTNPSSVRTLYQHESLGEISITEKLNSVSMTANGLLFISISQIPRHKLIELYSRIFQDAETMEMFRHGKPWTDTEVEKYVDDNILLWQKGTKFGVFAVFSENEFMGTMNLYERPTEYATKGRGHPMAIELGYIVRQEFWNKGIGSTIAFIAWQYIMHVNKKEMRFLEMIATAHPDNKASVNILSKVAGKIDAKAVVSYTKKQPRVLFWRWVASSRSEDLNTEHRLKSKL
jgi:RimJ/RimL family protein N-acetyltransferase